MESTDAIQARSDSLADAFGDFMSELVDLRKRHGLSQAEVGERMGVSQSAVAQFEHYDANPQLSTIRRYASAVGARVSFEVVDDLQPVLRAELPARPQTQARKAEARWSSAVVTS